MLLQQNKSISFVIPCFNEERRIKPLLSSIEKFQEIHYHDYHFEFILVNDGSTDLTTDKIFKHNLYRRNQIRYISYKNNIGKGYALKHGVLSSKKEWIITLDADLSVSFIDAIDIFNQSFSKNDLVYFGSRNHKNSIVKKKFNRFLFGLILNKLLKNLLKINLSDTQCGFKIYHKSIIKNIFGNLMDYSFAHDIEIVLLCRKYNIHIKEIPVIWSHMTGSKVRVFFHGVKMLKSILKFKKNLL